MGGFTHFSCNILMPKLLKSTGTKSKVMLLCHKFLKASEEIGDTEEGTRPASGSIPPPPPPPLPGGVPPPPPLTLDGVPARTLAVQPKVKLRPFFWNKVPAQLVRHAVYFWGVVMD